MNMIVFNKTICLKKMVQKNTGELEQKSIRSVRASLQMPSINFAIKAEAAGWSVDMIAIVRRSDFAADRYTHVEYNGISYRIIKAETYKKDMFIRLDLERG